MGTRAFDKWASALGTRFGSRSKTPQPAANVITKMNAMNTMNTMNGSN
jgi:hypothetical protein